MANPSFADPLKPLFDGRDWMLMFISMFLIVLPMVLHVGKTRSSAQCKLRDRSDIMKEAKVRWFKPDEIVHIITNRVELGLPITKITPQSPSSGSIFLFNRKEVKNFRNDDHQWKKKRGRNTTGESHMKLNVSIDDHEERKKKKKLNCYYAHGEQILNFQRRSYWMLQGDLSYIAFVHYRDVKQKECNTTKDIQNVNTSSIPLDANELGDTTYDDQFDGLDDLPTKNQKQLSSEYTLDDCLPQNLEQTAENDSHANEVWSGDSRHRDHLLKRLDEFLCLSCVGTPYYAGNNRKVSIAISKINALLKVDKDNHWHHVAEEIVQLKDKLRTWLTNKTAKGGKGAAVLDKDGQGVLHLAAALGYEWAIEPTIIAGVNINFPDKNGWTALHWAAHFGREWMVKLLIYVGANPEARSNPTPEHRSGQTPADLASAIGNKAIVEYLEQSYSTSCPSSLNLDALLNYEG